MPKNLYQLVIGSSELRKELSRGAITSLGLRFASGLLNFVVSIILARTLLPEGYGVYAFTLSTIAFLAVPVQMGIPTLVTREVARYHLMHQWGLLRGLLLRSYQVVVILSLATALVAGVVVWWLAESGTTEFDPSAFLWALPLLFLNPANRLQEATLMALRRVAQAMTPSMAVRPVVFLGLLGIAVMVGGLMPSHAIALYCASGGVAFIVGRFFLVQGLPEEVRAASSSYETKAWARSILPLSMITGLGVINGQTDLFMLGTLSSQEEVGLYRVAFSCATLVIYVLGAVNSVLAPHISRLHRSGDFARLQKMVTRSAQIVLAAAIPVAGGFILFGKPFLELVYGAAYRGSYGPLAVLCIAQLVNAAVGATHDILNMTGKEKETLKGVALAAILNVVLNALLIPPYGSQGAAYATGVSIAVVNVFLWHKVLTRVGLESSALAVRGLFGWKGRGKD